MSRYGYTTDEEIDRVLDAVEWAADKHKGQVRKGPEKEAYIGHPIRVMNGLRRAGVDDANMLTAAVLHDTIEDTGASFYEISHRFGKDVAEMVKAVTDDKDLPKAERKRKQIEHAAEMCKASEGSDLKAYVAAGAMLIKQADKLDNLRSFEGSRPEGWSDERVEGYFVWAFAVVARMKLMPGPLEDGLTEVFRKRGLDLKAPPADLQARLDAYYALL